jgi:hypothetical protein
MPDEGNGSALDDALELEAARRRFGLAYAETVRCLLSMFRKSGPVADAEAGCDA